MRTEAEKTKRIYDNLVKTKVITKGTPQSEIDKLVAIGNTLRKKMSPNIELEYDEFQQKAIACSSMHEIVNDPELEDFDEKAHDAELKKLLED